MSMQTGQRQKQSARETARGRRRKADSPQRAPLPAKRSRVTRRPAAAVPKTAPPVASIRVHGVDLDVDDRTYIRRKLGMKLGKFASSIERVSVRAWDANGPRGGVDQVCSVRVLLTGLPSVVVEMRSDSLEAAVDRAIDSAKLAVEKSLRRQRMRPIRRGTARRKRIRD